jgi:hypothetical protein
MKSAALIPAFLVAMAATLAAQQAVLPPPTTPGAFVAQEGMFKTDSMEFTLAPKGASIKLK